MKGRIISIRLIFKNQFYPFKFFIMETIQKKSASFKGIKSAGWVIVICFIVAVLIFHFVLGNPSNFMNNDPNNHPLPGNFLGTIYKGGFIVPVIYIKGLLIFNSNNGVKWYE